MDGDEVFALVACGIIALMGGVRGLRSLASSAWLRAKLFQRLSLVFVPIGCMAFVQWVLVRWAAKEVRDGPEYQALFVAGAAAWLVISCRAMLLLGLDIREDVIQRRNSAALAVVHGAFIGTTLTYAGANIGEGATIWTTFFPAVIGTLLLFVCWAIVEALGHVSTAVLLDRDVASGIRMAGLLIAAGLVLGRAAAGDWVSAQATMQDFGSVGWPALAITVLEATVHRRLAPSVRSPKASVAARGLLPAIGYVLLALAWDYYGRGR